MFGKIKSKLAADHQMLFVCVLTALCVAVMVFGAPSVQAEGVLKVGAYGGYFKDSFDKHIFPDFTKDTGIKVESVAEPTGEA
jgi:putative spermidine/putrescine transport system substrate-binding protein